MAGLKTIIYTNGVVVSTYDNGTPSDLFSGKLPVLHTIFKHINDKTLLSNEFKITSIKFYISNDPLCVNVLEVTESYLKHILQYMPHDKLEMIPVEQTKDIELNKIIEEANSGVIMPNNDFNTEKLPL